MNSLNYALDKDGVHARLIQDMENVCLTAGIPPRFIENSMVGVAQSPEIDWVKNFRAYSREYSGVVFEGGTKVETRMMAVCGALIRNFVDARLVSLGALVPLKPGNDSSFSPQDATVLLIPNLHVRTHGGKPLAAWQVQLLYDTLLSRMTAGKQTLVFVESLESVGNDFGVLFKEHLAAHYKKIKG